MKTKPELLNTRLLKNIFIALWAITAITARSSAYAQSAPIVANCLTNFISPLVVPITGELREILIDDSCKYVYVTNRSANRVEVFSLSTGALVTPITVGSQPSGLDTSPDGKTLYVANSGGNDISLVDLATGTETGNVFVPGNFINDTPFSLAVANNGTVLFSTTFAGSGFGGRMMQLDPPTKTVTQRTDFWFGGTNTEATFLKASGDRSAIGIVAGDISSGPVFKYLAATDTFTVEKDLSSFISNIALDLSGAVALVNPGTFILDSNLNMVGSIPGGSFGVAVQPSGTIGYQVGSSRIDVLDLVKFTKSDSLDIGDTVDNANPLGFGSGVGRMAISRDGQLLAVITDHGLSVVKTNLVKVSTMSRLSAEAEIELSGAARPAWFEVTTRFKLSADSDGIAPLKESVTLQLGSSTITIPAGALHGSRNGFNFSGKIGAVYLTAELKILNKDDYRFTANGSGIDLTGTSIPINVGLIIGNDQGSVKLVAGEVNVRSR
jgi:YVTN family beta-propeller protein